MDLCEYIICLRFSISLPSTLSSGRGRSSLGSASKMLASSWSFSGDSSPSHLPFIFPLSLFVLGFGLCLSASNQPFGLPDEEYDEEQNPLGASQKELFINATETETTHPAKMVEVLFFALFGVTDYEDAEISLFLMPWSSLLIKVKLARRHI